MSHSLSPSDSILQTKHQHKLTFFTGLTSSSLDSLESLSLDESDESLSLLDSLLLDFLFTATSVLSSSLSLLLDSLLDSSELSESLSESDSLLLSSVVVKRE